MNASFSPLVSFLLILYFFLAWIASPIHLPNAKVFWTCASSWHSLSEGRGTKVSDTKRVPDFRLGIDNRVDLKSASFSFSIFSRNIFCYGTEMSKVQDVPRVRRKCSKAFSGSEYLNSRNVGAREREGHSESPSLSARRVPFNMGGAGGVCDS